MMDTTSDKWMSTPKVAAIFTESMDPSFLTQGDEMPKG